MEAACPSDRRQRPGQVPTPNQQQQMRQAPHSSLSPLPATAMQPNWSGPSESEENALLPPYLTHCFDTAAACEHMQPTPQLQRHTHHTHTHIPHKPHTKHTCTHISHTPLMGVGDGPAGQVLRWTSGWISPLCPDTWLMPSPNSAGISFSHTAAVSS